MGFKNSYIPTIKVGASGSHNITYNDMLIDLGRSRFVGGSEPSWTNYKGGEVVAFDVGEKVEFNLQHDHSVKLGAEFDYHIHYVLPIAPLAAEQIRFQLSISFAGIGEAFPAESTYNNEIIVGSNGLNLNADTHYLLEVADIIPSSGQTVSSAAICTLERIAVTGTEYSNPVYVLFSDFHFQLDTFGSLKEDSKV